MTEKPPRLVTCPCCGKPTPYATTNRWRPFCSERCKLIDLGQWATESYRLLEPDAAPSDRKPCDE